MPAPATRGYAYNRTREAYLATDLVVADTHWSRLRGLLGAGLGKFSSGKGLWIVPCRGVHTMGMRFPIDVVYLSADKRVVHLIKSLRPWRVAPVRIHASTVLELPSTTVTDTHTAVGDTIEIAFGDGGKA